MQQEILAFYISVNIVDLRNNFSSHQEAKKFQFMLKDKANGILVKI